MYNIYEALAMVHNWCPLIVIMLFILSKVSLACRSLFTQVSQVHDYVD